jgi:hypothetical protein
MHRSKQHLYSITSAVQAANAGGEQRTGGVSANARVNGQIIPLMT